MLGYVKIDKGELKVREYEIYCGYYCGICKYIGKQYGQLPRMSLSYDAAFLAVMLASLDETADVPVQEHCAVHHIRKKTVVQNAAVEYAGDIMLILAWHKLLDDARDEGRLYAKAAMLLMKPVYRKLSRRYPALCRDIEGNLAELSAQEAAGCENLDRTADAFSKIMERIFTEGIHRLYGSGDILLSDGTSADEETFCTCNEDGADVKGHAGEETGAGSQGHQQRPLLTIEAQPPAALTPAETLAGIGYHMGKWIYLLDAADDLEENIASGAYNPLLRRFQYDPASETPQSFQHRIEEPLRFNLFHCLSVIGNYVDTLDLKKNQGIIENVIYFGLNRKTEEVIAGTESAKEFHCKRRTE